MMDQDGHGDSPFYPFETTRIFMWGMEVIMGDQKDEANSFYWYSDV